MGISLAGQTVLVTGVSSGLGEGVARVFAAYGAHVVGVARRADRGEALRHSIAGAGGSMTFVAGDITEAGCRERAIAACLEKVGRIDVLINNAAVSGAVMPIEQSDPADWDRTLEVNLTAAYHLCRLAVGPMREQQSGVILNIASINAVFGITKMAPYCAAKAGLVHLTKVIAAETIQANIRANAVILGGVLSEMGVETAIAMARSATGATETPSAERVQTMSSRMMKPEAVARSLAALCLPEAALITGSEICIDQAMTAGAAASTLVHGGAAAALFA